MNTPDEGFLPGESVEEYMRRTGMWRETTAARSIETRSHVHDAFTKKDTSLDSLTANARMRAAVDEAVRMGIVHEERYESAKPDANTAYVLASGHFDPGQNAEKQPEEAKRAQIELFRLAYLIEQRGASPTVLVEGTPHTGKPNKTNNVLLPNPDGTSTRLSDPSLQKRFFEQPDELMHVIDALLRRPGSFWPLFYRLGTLPFDGAESAEAAAKYDAMEPIFLRVEDVSKRILEPLRQAVIADGSLRVQASSGHAKRFLRFNEKIVTSADDFIREMQGFLEDVRTWKSFNLQRETETARLLRETPAGSVPLAWMGAAHAPSVAKLLSPDMNVTILTPASSTHFDQTSIEQRVNELVRLAESVLQTAKAVLRNP